MNRTVLIALFTAISAQLSGAQHVWTLDSCINYAIEHNIDVRNRQIEKISAELDIIEAKDKFLPSVNASASQSFNFGRGLTSENTYADRNTKNFQWGVNMDLPVFQGLSAIRQLKLSKINLRSMLLQLEAAKDNVTLNVISQYLQVLYSKEMLKTAHEQVELSEYELSRQKALAEAGKIAEVDVLQAESQLAADRLTLTDNESNLTIAMLDLVQMLQLPTIEGFDIKPIDDNVIALLSPEKVYKTALISNNRIKAAENEIESAKASISLAKTGYIPKLSLNAGIGSGYYNISGTENVPFHRQMRDNLNKSIGFSLSIPIFNAFSTRNSVRKARIRETTAQLQLYDTQTSLYKEIQQAYYRAKAAGEKYATSTKTEDISRLSFLAMKEKYELGRSNPTEFEQAKTSYNKTTIERIQARYEYILRCRILDFYSKTGQ